MERKQDSNLLWTLTEFAIEIQNKLHAYNKNPEDLLPELIQFNRRIVDEIILAQDEGDWRSYLYAYIEFDEKYNRNEGVWLTALKQRVKGKDVK